MKLDKIQPSTLRKQSLDYAKTGFFGKIALDYLSENERLKPFYNRFSKISSFKDQMREKSENYRHRLQLTSVLQNQYSRANLKSPSLELLKSENAFTITTGHQVCLFTGPLYFFYKIISAINTCKKLSESYPDNHFIPIYWMATEDHDFEEANHFYLPSGKIEWESGQGGAVGRMKTVGMEQVVEELREKLGIGYSSGELIDLFTKAYVAHKTISEATRFLVHQIFGSYGVLVVEADDPELKKLAIPAFEMELTKSVAEQAMRDSDKALAEAGYHLQVEPHAINLFYLDEELRERIEKDDSGTYKVLRTNKKFTQEEILDELHEHPEKFSPNVILRPLYQEIILPNLAYIGGGGELAYWFQLKSVFESFGIPFPVLMLRNSVMIVDAPTQERMNQLGISVQDIFQPQQELEDELVHNASSESLELDKEREDLEKVFLAIEARLRKINSDLEKSVRSGYARTDRIVRNLEKKMIRAERKKQEILTGRLEKVYNYLLPRGGLQERNMNFAPIYLSFGKTFVDQLIENLNPFDFTFTVLVEE